MHIAFYILRIYLHDIFEQNVVKGVLKMDEYGYVRVSSRDQNVDRQVAAMCDMGLDKNKLYIEWQSGKDFRRPKYRALVKKMRRGDTLFVKSIDRLGRNYEEILEQWRYLTVTKEVDIVVIDFPLLNTKNQQNGLTGRFISDLVLQILSYIAQVERENIRQRQREGIKIAKHRGVIFGRPKMGEPQNFGEIYELWDNELLSKRQAAKLLNTSRSTTARWIKDKDSDN